MEIRIKSLPNGEYKITFGKEHGYCFVPNRACLRGVMDKYLEDSHLDYLESYSKKEN